MAAVGVLQMIGFTVLRMIGFTTRTRKTRVKACEVRDDVIVEVMVCCAPDAAVRTSCSCMISGFPIVSHSLLDGLAWLLIVRAKG